jgi:hypothetical protein
MTCDLVRQNIAEALSIYQEENNFLVRTTCLYPSFRPVEVWVTPHEDGYLITDNRAGLVEILSYGITTKKPGEWLGHYARYWDVTYRDGKIFTKISRIDDLATAILRVANASRDGVLRIIETHKFPTEIPFNIEFGNYIHIAYPEKFRPLDILGGSGKRHHFNFVYAQGIDNYQESIISPDTAIVIDPVEPVERSVLFRTSNHRDLRELGKPGIEDFLVFNDDDSRWDKSMRHLLFRDKLPTITYKELKQAPPDSFKRLAA